MKPYLVLLLMVLAGCTAPQPRYLQSGEYYVNQPGPHPSELIYALTVRSLLSEIEE